LLVVSLSKAFNEIASIFEWLDCMALTVTDSLLAGTYISIELEELCISKKD